MIVFGRIRYRDNRYIAGNPRWAWLDTALMFAGLIAWLLLIWTIINFIYAQVKTI